MDHSQIKQQINDVPPVFKRVGPNYNSFSNSLIIGMIALGDQLNNLKNQLNLNTAQASWLDVWGALFNLPRFAYEDDAVYQTRIRETLLAWASTVPGITRFLKNVYNLDVTVKEDLTSSNYQIQFSRPLARGQLDSIAAALNNIRPAGIPYLHFDIVTLGPFVNTSGFIGMTQMTGAYLTGGTSGYQPTLSPNTPSVVSKLPTDLLNFTSLSGVT